MVQSQAMIDDVRYALAEGQDLDQLKRSFETAMRSGGAFVEFTVEGNREVSALVSPTTRVMLSVETVQFDEHDTGDLDFSYSEPYDL